MKIIESAERSKCSTRITYGLYKPGVVNQKCPPNFLLDLWILEITHARTIQVWEQGQAHLFDIRRKYFS